MKRTSLIAVALVFVVISGCAQHKRVEVWKPKPTVHWADLTSSTVVPVRDTFRIIPGSMRGGIFPTSLGVTRIAIEKTGDAVHPFAMELMTDPRNEFIQWNSALDDQFAVGEVFPIRVGDLGGGPKEPEQILAAFKALDAGLGLVYAVNEISETETEMIGVLFDTERKTPLAVLHAYESSTVPPEVVEQSDDEISMWETDSRALVRAEFETVLHDCVHELIQRHRPEKIVVPVGWKATTPARSVIWPPR